MSTLLVVDVGNTNTRFGAWQGGEVTHLSVVATAEAATSAAVADRMQAWAAAAGLPLDHLELAICSVVPEAQQAWGEWAAAHQHRLLLVRGDTPAPLHSRYRRPDHLGPDRLAAAVGAVRRLGAPVIVASLGTATVVDAVSAERTFLGGAIAAGVETGLAALSEKTRELPRVQAAAAPAAIGGDTEECMQVGAVEGTAALIEGLADRMCDALGTEAPLALTGGHAQLISPHLRRPHQVFATLSLEGVAAIWEHNRGGAGCG